MSNRYQAGILRPGYNALKVPDVPTVGTATAASANTVSVAFTAPSCVGGGAISSYTAYASCGVYTASGASSPLTVTGLTTGTAYTFKAIATNAFGPSYPSSVSNSATTWSVPGAPTIGTASISVLTASVPFTAPVSNGGATITSYTATSSPSGITGTLSQAGSGTITVSGLSTGTAYTFTVTATNAIGTSAASAASNSVTPALTCQTYTTAGSYTFIVPSGVTSLSVVGVGGGAAGIRATSCCGGTAMGGGGGALAYLNNYSVTPGQSIAVIVGSGGTSNGGAGTKSEFVDSTTLRAQPGTNGNGGTYTGTGGGNGGGSQPGACLIGTGGGGAGGYSGTGGNGRSGCPSSTGQAGSGGGGGGGGYGLSQSNGGGGGGGVGLLGQGCSGVGGSSVGNRDNLAGGGSGGGAGAARSGTTGGSGGLYGGGGGGGSQGPGGGGSWGNGGGGAVRIIWPGTTRTFPTTNVGA